MYELWQRPHLDSVFGKLAKKDKNQFDILQKKIQEILLEPYKFKPMRVPLQGQRRVHIGKSYVLTYSIDEANKRVILEDYDHHDNIYKK